MPKESNYFEEAYELCSDSDPIISRTATLLYQEMTKQHNKFGLVPEGDFNIYYFFQSVARTLLFSRPSTKSNINSQACGPIKIFMLPSVIDTINESYFVRTGLFEIYLDLLQIDSDQQGDLFDVTFAFEIVSAAIDEASIAWIFGNGDTVGPPNGAEVCEFDYWLSGFNSNQSE